jgi:hypothetical protein
MHPQQHSTHKSEKALIDHADFLLSLSSSQYIFVVAKLNDCDTCDMRHRDFELE